MSKLGKAYLEATQDDMGGEPLSHEAELIRAIIDNNKDASVEEAVDLGWSVHDIHTAINRLTTFKGNLSPIKEELALLTAQLAAVSKKAGNK